MIFGALAFEPICEFAVTENVDEKFAVGLEPDGNLFQELFPVAHALEHFDGNDAVEGFRRVERVHVCGEDGEVLQAPGQGLGFNVFLLGARV